MSGFGTRGMALQRRLELRVFRSRERKQGIGVYTGDGSALGEGHSDVRKGNVLRKFGNDEDIKGAQGEERGLQLSPEFFDGFADGFVAIIGITEKPLTGVCGIAHLMAIEGHAFATFLGAGRNTVTLRLGAAVVKSERKKEMSMNGHSP